MTCLFPSVCVKGMLNACLYLLKLSPVLGQEDAYNQFAKFLSPSISSKEHQDYNIYVKRSWRAMQVLSQDLKQSASRPGLINSSQAGLLAKDLFASLDNTTDQAFLLHKRTLLENLLETYPGAVIPAVCAGGTKGMEKHLRPLLSAQSSSQTIPTVTNLVLFGCMGKKVRASAERTLVEEQQNQFKLHHQHQRRIATGHRRKFVRSLSEWGFLSRMVESMEEQEANPTVGEDVCESILTIVECVGYPSDESQDSVGERAVLDPLGTPEWWAPLVEKLGPQSSSTTRVAATRAMMGILTLATGKSSRLRKSNAPLRDASEAKFDDNIAKTTDDARELKNLIREWRLTELIHQSLVSHLPQLVQATLHNDNGIDQQENPATIYFEREEDPAEIAGVPHPGRYRVIPFTSWRLHMVALLTEILTWQDDEIESDGPLPRVKAMSAIMELPLPLSLLPDGAEQAHDEIINPWPKLCDWVFDYPENSLYHFQFVRLFQAVCLEHHEQTLRLVLQKVKFVSRAIKACKQRTPLRGVLITCLNSLRLRSLSLPRSAFLRQFLESHDAWKAFKDDLKE